MRNDHIANAGKVMLVLLVVLVGLVGAQTPIYRSVQPGVTAAIGTGTGTLTISGSTATFSVSQPDSIGVGDAIQYDSDGNSSIDAIAFIHGRTSGTEYTVKNAAGAAPTAVAGDEDWDIFRAYTSIASVEGGTENTGINAAVRGFDGSARNLDSNAEIFNLAVYAGTEGNGTNIDWDSWDTSATEYINIFAPFLESHVGISQMHKYNLKYSLKFDLASATDLTGHVRIDGIVTRFEPPGSVILFESSASGGDFRISNCKFFGSDHVSANAAINYVGLTGAGNGTNSVYIWNNFISGFRETDGGGAGRGIVSTGNLGNAANTYTYNNTIVDCDVALLDFFNANLHRVKNNIAQCDAGLIPSNNKHADSDYNLSSDTNAPGANSIQSTTLVFVDAASGDFHLTSSDAAIAIGTDLSGDASLPFSTDIDGDTRSTWNMGADEFQAEPSVSGWDLLLRRRAVR